MERCQRCKERKHLECAGLKKLGWCECPCHTGETIDPLGTFLADLGVLRDGSVTPLLDDQVDPTI